ncbi:MAG: tRNA (guanosine(37)-N1)-methyltransferase TrmD, partial [Thermoleophilaceae bacterium]|nr:tRNA (guanosine(37)-N1)-methyltransferase TrmD [Thermoleophilaceae bacterium]
MQIDVFTLFPEWFEWFSQQRHIRNLQEHGLQLDHVDMRSTTPISNARVDDTPYGGGAGMVIRVDVVEAALRGRYDDVDPVELRQRRRVIVLSPTGRRLDDALASELATEQELTILCGRYEGFDERIHDHFASDIISIGDYVLSGGELAAMVLIDA